MTIRPGIELLNCSCTDLPSLAGRADLVIADPPWLYSQKFGAKNADDHYPGLPTSVIRDHLGRFLGSRLALWMTFPLLPEWITFPAPAGWALKTGGAWLKSGAEDSGHYGQGYHWAGCSELVLVYAGRSKGAGYNSRSKLRNATHEPPNEHSRKPVLWQAQMVTRWVPPGGLVVDPYAGLGSVAEAVILAGEGRRYLGAEVDPAIHARAVELLREVA